MMALGCGLAEHGHQVAIAASLDFRETVTASGLDYEEINASVAELSRTAAGREWLGGQARNQSRELRAMQDFFASAADPIARMLIRTCDYDQIITTRFLLEATLTLRKNNLTVAMLQPDFTTRDGRSSIAAPIPEASYINRIATHFYQRAARRFFAPFTKAICRLTGFPRMSFHQHHNYESELLHLLASSPAMTPIPADIHLNAEATGFWQLPAPTDYPPPAALKSFLNTSPAPIYIGFGSMNTAEPAALSRLITQALQACDARAVIHRGAADLTIPTTMAYTVDHIPHSWLFPQVAAVIHHGGAGTTGNATRAGVPQVIIPHMGDQYFWGRRLHELGVSPAPIPRKEMTATRLTNAIMATRDPVLVSKAAKLGKTLAAEDGVSAAIASLERSWTRSHPHR